jgi:hypothetical protein
MHKFVENIIRIFAPVCGHTVSARALSHRIISPAEAERTDVLQGFAEKRPATRSRDAGMNVHLHFANGSLIVSLMIYSVKDWLSAVCPKSCSSRISLFFPVQVRCRISLTDLNKNLPSA